MIDTHENGLTYVQSCHAYDVTVQRVLEAIQSRGIPILAQIDHAEGARQVGLAMRPTLLILFGNAKKGTPLMVQAPSIAIDLPLKILVSEDEAGVVWLAYNSLPYLKQRHAVAEELLANIAAPEAICSEAAA